MKTNTIYLSAILLSYLLVINNIEAQNKLSNYSKGFYVTNEKDTIIGFLKNLSLAGKCSKIRFKKNNDTKPINISPKTITSYKIKDEIFISINIGSNDYPKYSFLKPIISGVLTYYKRWISRSDYYGSYEILQTYLKLENEDIFKVRKTNFKKQTSTYLAANHEISNMILNKKLDIDDLEIIVKKYNQWYLNGAINDPKLKEENDQKLKQISDPKLALELPLSITRNFILVEAQIKEVIEVKEQIGYDFGIGLRYSATDEIKLRFGIHYWNLPINPSYTAIGLDSYDREIKLNVIENSELKNIGIYFHLQYEAEHAFIGGGFNIGLTNSYSTRLSYYDEFYNYIGTITDSKSLISDDFNNQSHFEIIGGAKFKATPTLTLKPFIKLNLPLQSIYDSGAPENTAFDMYSSTLNIGLIIDIGLSNK